MFEDIKKLKALPIKLTEAQVAKHLNIDTRTVKKYWDMDEKEYLKLLREHIEKKQESILDKYAEEIIEWLKKFRFLSAAQIYDRLKENYPDFNASNSLVRKYVAKLKEKYNLNKNIAVFPKVIAIKPGAKQVVRFRVKPSKELAEGENKSYLVFKELPPNIKTTASKNSEGETSTNISILTELGISIYGHTGEEIIKGRLEDVKLTAKNNYISLKGNAVSEGNTSIKFRYKVESTGGKILSEGVLGYSPRNGKTQIGLGLGKFPEMAGKDIVVKVFDQKEKLYYEKKIKL